MKPAVLLLCACALHAQITAALNRLPDGSSEIRLCNESPVRLDAFAISIDYVSSITPKQGPLLVYVDPAIDAWIELPARRRLSGPLPPGQEFAMSPDLWVAVSRQGERARFEKPVVAGIFADGATAGDAALLTRMLLAIETTLEALSDAGRRNVPRSQMIEQFKKLENALDHWYLPAEQQIGRGVYQEIVGKLMNLPEGELGSPFPPATFVTQENQALNRQRAALLASRPSLAESGLFVR